MSRYAGAARKSKQRIVTRLPPAPVKVQQSPLAIEAFDLIEDDALLGPHFIGPSWRTHKVILKASLGHRLTREELRIFHTVAGGRDPPRKRVKELWYAVSRRGGKDSIASAIITAAALRDYRAYLRPGERATCLLLACDRGQAKIVYRYVLGYFENNPLLRPLIEGEPGREGFALKNGNEIIIATNSFRTVRGRTFAACVLDECAFYRDETSASPDTEVYSALLPGLTTIPNSLLVGISSPYRKAGLLYERYKDLYGKADNDALFVKGASRTFNPTLPQAFIDKQIEQDPQAAQAEWLGEFRNDIASFILREAVESVIISDRRELPWARGITYSAFVDPSGGSADSFTLAIAHRTKDNVAILDTVREWRPPFSPESVVKECATLLKTYSVTRVTGDRYGGEFPRELFRNHGIKYEPSPRSKSDLYVEALPLINAGRVELLDHKRLHTQLIGLERRTSRSGKDSIDHAPGAHDDIANVVCGALVQVGSRPSHLDVWHRIGEDL